MSKIEGEKVKLKILKTKKKRDARGCGEMAPVFRESENSL